MGDVIERVKVFTYEGTMSSLEELLQNLKLNAHDYSFNIITGEIYIRSKNLRLRPGNCYQVRMMEERFEVIG